MVAWSVCAVLATVELIKEISCRFRSLKPETQQTPFVNHPMNNLMFDWNSWLFIKLARSWNNHEGSLSLKVLSVFWEWAGFSKNNSLTKKIGFGNGQINNSMIENLKPEYFKKEFYSFKFYIIRYVN